MKIYLFLFLTFLSTISSYAKWEKANGLLEDIRLNSFAVASDNSIYVCTNDKLLKSTDNGKTWTNVPTDQDKYSTNYFTDMNFEINGDLVIQANSLVFRLKKNHSIVKTIPFVPIDVYYYDTTYYKLAYIFDHVGIIGYQDFRYYNDNIQGNVNIGNSIGKLNFRYINSVTSSPKNGIVANFNYSELFNINFNLYRCSYYTLDTGKAWIQFNTIPGTNIYGTEFLVLNDELWLYNANNNNYLGAWRIYNSKNEKIEDLNMTERQIYYSKSKNSYAVYNRSEILILDSDAKIMKRIKNELTKNNISKIKKAQLSDNGILYILDDNGNLFNIDTETDAINQIKLNGVLNNNLRNFQKSANALYCTNSKDKIYYSLDAGRNWNVINISNSNSNNFTLNYSVNKHNEIVYSYKDSIYYTDDFGKTIKTIQKDYYSGFKTVYLKIFDNGSIYENSSIGYFSHSKNETLNALNMLFTDLVQVSDSSFLALSYFNLLLVDKNFEKTENIKFTFTNSDYSGSFAKFIRDNNNLIYLHTNEGYYLFDKSKNIFLPGNKFYSKSIAINNLNEYYFIKDNQIFFNPKNICFEDNLDLAAKREIIYIDSNLVLLSDDCYFTKIEAKKHLYINQINAENPQMNSDTSSIELIVVDDDKIPVENAKVYIKNDYNLRFDTLLTDKNGIVKYHLNKKKYGFIIDFIHVVAEKDDYMKSEKRRLDIIQTYNQLVTVRLVNHISIQEYFPGDSLIQNAEMYFYYNNKSAYGSLIVHNSFNNTTDSLNSSNSKFIYKFKIPEDAKAGIYRMDFKAQCAESDTSVGVWTYFLVHNMKFLSVLENKHFSNDLKIYPNPSSEFITIDANNDIQNENMMIYSSDGTLILNSLYSNKIDITKLSNGLYYVVIGNKFGKFIKQ